MMKKMTRALLALSLTTAVMADAKTATGFYLGVEGGAANTNTRTTFGMDPAARTRKTDAGNTGVLGGLFVGYGRVIDNSCIYFGGEVYAGLDGSKVETKDTAADGTVTSTAKVSRKNYYGLAARVGYFVTPSTLAYLRLGAEAGKWETTISVPGAVDPEEKNAKGSNNRISFAPGIGMETYLTNNMFLRADYSYLVGPKYTTSRKIRANLKEEAKVKISQHRMKLAIGYKF
jgi:opacity protein-like surface antigen